MYFLFFNSGGLSAPFIVKLKKKKKLKCNLELGAMSLHLTWGNKIPTI